MDHDKELVAASRIRLNNCLRPVEKVSLSDFEKLKVLGVGSYGKVFLVQKTDSGHAYAMKVIEKYRITRDIKLTEFRRNEREIMEKAQGFNFLINMEYAFQTASKLFLITDFAIGGQLLTHLPACMILPSDKFRIYAGEIVLALERLHAMGVIHRDLTPKNILLDASGHLVLADFGCSKAIENGRTSSVCGTIDYWAPERASTVYTVGYGKACDWWAFGVLLFQLSTGEMPFKRSLKHDDVDVVKRSIMFSQPTIPTHLDQDLRDLIKNLLIKSPNERLGGENGDARPIKNHKYFSSLIWKDVAGKKYTAPIQLQSTDHLDTRYFHHTFTNLPLVDTPSPVTHQHLQLFKRYSFVSPEKLTLLRRLNNLNNLGIPTRYGVLFCSSNRTPFFQKYKLVSEKKIGDGAFAICFKCESLATKEIFAVKIINVSNDITEEIKTLRACQGHKNIVKLIDVVHETKYIYIVLEFLEGGDLFDYSAENGRMEEDLVKEIFYQIVQGVRHMHSLRVVHRDLKLENILFINNQSNDVKIVDFGLATIMPDNSATNGGAEPVGMTSKCYTFEYAAPEVLMLDRTNYYTKTKQYTEACDLWSLGIILFKMITGEHAFRDCNTSDTMTYNDGQDGGVCTISHILEYLSNGAYDKGKLTKYKLSKEVESVIMGLLTWDPKKRLNIRDLENHEWFDIQNITRRVIYDRTSDDCSSGDSSTEDGVYASSDSVNNLLDALLSEESNQVSKAAPVAEASDVANRAEASEETVVDESSEVAHDVVASEETPDDGALGVTLVDKASEVAHGARASEVTTVDGASELTTVDGASEMGPDDEGSEEILDDEALKGTRVDEASGVIAEASEAIAEDEASEVASDDVSEGRAIPVREEISYRQEPVAGNQSISANDPVIVISDSESEENIPNSSYDNWVPQPPWNVPQHPHPGPASFNASNMYNSNYDNWGPPPPWDKPQQPQPGPSGLNASNIYNPSYDNWGPQPEPAGFSASNTYNSNYDNCGPLPSWNMPQQHRPGPSDFNASNIYNPNYNNYDSWGPHPGPASFSGSNTHNSNYDDWEPQSPCNEPQPPQPGPAGFNESNTYNSNYDDWEQPPPWNEPQQPQASPTGFNESNSYNSNYDDWEQSPPWNEPPWNGQPEPVLANYSATFITYQSNSRGITVTATTVNTRAIIFNTSSAPNFSNPTRTTDDIYSNISSPSPDFNQSNSSHEMGCNNQFHSQQTTDENMHNYRPVLDVFDPAFQNRMNNFYEQHFSTGYQNNTRRELFGLNSNLYRNQSPDYYQRSTQDEMDAPVNDNQSYNEQQSRDDFEQNTPIDLSMPNRIHNQQKIPDGFQQSRSTGIGNPNDISGQPDMPCDLQQNTPSAKESPRISAGNDKIEQTSIDQPLDLKEPTSDETQPSVIESSKISEKIDIIEQFNSDQPIHPPTDFKGTTSDHTQPSAIELSRISDKYEVKAQFDSDQLPVFGGLTSDHIHPSAMERPKISERSGKKEQINIDQPVHQTTNFKKSTNDPTQPSAIKRPRISERNEVKKSFNGNRPMLKPPVFGGSTSNHIQPSAIKRTRISKGNGKKERITIDQPIHQPPVFKSSTSDPTEPSTIKIPKISERNELKRQFSSNQPLHKPPVFGGSTSNHIQPSEKERPRLSERIAKKKQITSGQPVHQPPDFKSSASDPIQSSAIKLPKISKRNEVKRQFNSNQPIHKPAVLGGSTSNQIQPSEIGRPRLSERIAKRKLITSGQPFHQPPDFKGHTSGEIQRVPDILENISTIEEIQSTPSKPKPRLLNPTTSSVFPFCSECRSYKSNLQLRRVSITPQKFSMSVGGLGASERKTPQDHYKIICHGDSENGDVTLKKIPLRPQYPTAPTPTLTLVKRIMVPLANQPVPEPPIKSRKGTDKKSHQYKRKPP